MHKFEKIFKIKTLPLKFLSLIMLRFICGKVKKFQRFLLIILQRNCHFKKAGAKFARLHRKPVVLKLY